MKAGTRKRAAEALAEFLSLPKPRKEAFDFVCGKHDIARRTLTRWLQALDTDAELANLVQSLREPGKLAWAERLAQTKDKFLDELVKGVEELKTNTPDAVRAKADALKTITDIERTDQVAAAYLNQAAQSAVGRIEASGPRALLVGDAEYSEADDSVSEAEQASASSLAPSGQEDPANAGSGLG